MMAGNTTKKQNNKINFGKISKTKITLLILIAFFFVATIVTNSQQSSGMPMGMPPGVAGNKTAVAQWIQQFSLTIECSDSNLGYITNTITNQIYDANTQFTSTAYVSAVGYSLLYWQDDLGNKIYENPLNVTLTRDSVYTAVFGKAVELNGVCAVDINLLGGDAETQVVGYVAMNGYSTNDVVDIHLWALASSGYKFEYWTIDGEIVTYNGTDPYPDNCYLPIELVQGKIVVANFSKINNSNVEQGTDNVR